MTCFSSSIGSICFGCITTSPWAISLRCGTIFMNSFLSITVLTPYQPSSLSLLIVGLSRQVGFAIIFADSLLSRLQKYVIFSLLLQLLLLMQVCLLFFQTLPCPPMSSCLLPIGHLIEQQFL